MTGLEIAVIGMAARFPGARDIDEFWNNLKNGIESITFFSDEELQATGLDPSLIENSAYVKAGAILEDIEYFDPFFFDCSKREGELMDPQVRIFHQTAWTALEHAGYTPRSYKGLIGLYAGASAGINWEAALKFSGESDWLKGHTASQLVRKEMMSLRVSYKLNLKGPVFTLYTACSTSLVAIHLACQALLIGECDMALAGGVAVSLPQISGYLHHEGMVVSADGHCRSFDSAAGGTVNGNGAGIVVLKRLKEAIDHGDYIHAVIKGSAINNDGNRKVGFNAPSIKGQVEVIRAAQKMADIEPESVSYIEAHGTGTIIGDPIEMKALNQAFNTQKKSFCAIGSAKTNFGHLDAAAGVAGVIKTILALKHRLIPPNLHFKRPNPQLEIESSPFYIVSQLKEWTNDKYPLRAGISSFGIGGTNAHVILEEAPAASESVNQWVSESVGQSVNGQGTVVRGRSLCPPSETGSREYQLILLSAKTMPALERMTQNLALYFKKNPTINLADAAYTLQVGRQSFKFRRRLVCASVEEAVVPESHSRNTIGSNTSSPLPQQAQWQTSIANEKDNPIIFMFPGQGAQYVNMGRELYEKIPLFRQEMDRCFEEVKSIMGYDIKEILYPGTGDSPLERGTPDPSKGGCVFNINQTEIAQPLLFIFEYALAQLLMKGGIMPDAMIGHSIGEYVAACLAGVLSLEDALQIVTLRGKLMQQLPAGSMLSISISPKELQPLLQLNKHICLAAVNSPKLCVISGPHQSVNALARQLNEKGYESKILHTSHAFHSAMMAPILDAFANKIKQISFHEPKIPYISNLSGNLMTPGDAIHPGYWVNHLRETVKFSQGIDYLLKEKSCVFLEVGPGRTLSTLVRQHKYNEGKDNPLAINLVRHPKEKAADTYYWLSKIGELWLYGVKIDWQKLLGHQVRYRVPLPTYSFDRIHCWPGGDFTTLIGTTAARQPHLFKIKDKTEWFYVPSWERSPLTNHGPTGMIQPGWLVFMDTCGFGTRLLEGLGQQAKDVITVHRGEAFAEEEGNQYSINPRQGNHYHRLFDSLRKKDKIPTVILHLWGIDRVNHQELTPGLVEKELNLGFSSLIHIVQAVEKNNISGPLRIGVVTGNMQEVTGEEKLCPAKAAVLAPVKIIPLEYPHITCQSIDILVPEPGSPREDIYMDYLLQELSSSTDSSTVEPLVAYRGKHRWVQTFKPVRLDTSRVKEMGAPLREGCVCLVTGGHRDLGLAAAEYLLKRVKARLVLVVSPAFPPREKWHEWLSLHKEEDKICRKIRRFQELEASGTPLMIRAADLSDAHMMKKVMAQALERFGQINGIIHAAGNDPDDRKIREISMKTTLAAKIKSVLVLDQVLKEMNLQPGFFVLFSSIGTVVYPSQVGQVTQCAANDFLDAFANYKISRNHIPTATIDHWPDPREIKLEWHDFFNAVLANKLPRVAISPVDIRNLILHYDKYKALKQQKEAAKTDVEENEISETSLLQRQGLSAQYKAPRDKTEKALANTWKQFFGIEQPGIDDDFFELGGDSLQAMTLIATIHQKLQVKIPLDFFFANPTIRKLAQYIDNQGQADLFSPLQPVEKKEYYPLIPVQNRLMFLHQAEVGELRYRYNLFLGYLIRGEFDRERLIKIFKQLINRHEVFRTSFEIIKGEPEQRIHNQKDVEHRLEFDYCEADQSKIDEKVKSFRRPFELHKAPLMRVGLIKIPDNGSREGKYLIMLEIHHIISDGISMQIILKELMNLARGEKLPGIKIHYKDYAQWYKNELASGWLEKQEEYWLQQFETGVPLLNLPTDYPRPDRKSLEGRSLGFNISQEQIRQLKALALEKNATLYMVILAIFNILIAKLSNQEDIVLLTMVNGRSCGGLEQIVGMFVNTLFLRNYPREEKTFNEFFNDLRTRTLMAFKNQDYHTDALVDKVIDSRDQSRHPITDVGFMLQNIGMPQLGSPQMQIEPYKVHNEMAMLDLGLMVVESGENLSFRFEYCTKLFKQETIERFVKYFMEILETVLDNRDITLKNITITHGLLSARPVTADFDLAL